MSECLECGVGDGEATIHQHHTNYERDETVPLCASCHRTVHNVDEHELKPDDENPNEKVMIWLENDVRDKLRSRKVGSETYSDVIVRLLEETEDE